MVIAVRAGQSLREVAVQYSVSAPTVQYWIERAKGQRMSRMDFHDGSRAPHFVANRTSARIESQVLQLRRKLKEQSDLGEFGAQAFGESWKNVTYSRCRQYAPSTPFCNDMARWTTTCANVIGRRHWAGICPMSLREGKFVLLGPASFPRNSQGG